MPVENRIPVLHTAANAGSAQIEAHVVECTSTMSHSFTRCKNPFKSADLMLKQRVNGVDVVGAEPFEVSMGSVDTLGAVLSPTDIATPSLPMPRRYQHMPTL